MDGLSLNIAQDKLSQLRQLFPEVFREDQIDFDALKSILGEKIAPPNQERYGLSWAGKYDAYREIQKQTTATLTPDRANSINFDTSENVFIEGENLEVLRVLQKSYYGKVKMIYIDPPYNTGNDSFVYPDDYSERQEAYRKRTGITNEAGFLNKQDLWKKNTKESGQFHSVWLSMMFPRLFLSRNLLKENGVIFVSIDDNEKDNLKILLDEVFGLENFIACICWQKRYAPSNDTIDFSPTHDFVLVYAKNRKTNDLGKILPTINRLERSEEQNKAYKNPDNDERGVWKTGDYTCNKTAEQRPNLYFPVTQPYTNEEIWPSKTAVWRYSQEKHERNVRENRVWWGINKDNKVPAYKRFLSEVPNIIAQTWWPYQEAGHNDEAKKEFQKLFPEAESAFDTPKPTKLIKKIIQLGSDAEENDIILDFFAGSSSTAQAVLDLNKEDGGNRSFLCVQLPELLDPDNEAYKIGYKTIADVGRARIRKVLEKQIEKQNGQLPFQETEPLGFRAYKLTQTHFKVWRSDLSNPADILNQLDLFQHPLTNDYQSEALLTELLLKAGYSLTVLVEREELVGVPVYRINNGTTYMALESISRELIEVLTTRQPQRLITLDKLFNQDNELLSNTRLQLREAGIEFAVI